MGTVSIIRSSLVTSAVVVVVLTASNPSVSTAFTPTSPSFTTTRTPTVARPLSNRRRLSQNPLRQQNAESSDEHSEHSLFHAAAKFMTSIACTAVLSAALLLSPAFAEDELMAKYGGKGFDTSLVDQTCLVDKCSLQAKACLADDPSCRKGLTCTAKCLGDNACITGCMARYGNVHLDNLLKCTIEDHDCIKIAILDGGADVFGQEPRAPAPTLQHFQVNSMEGSWYKVVGFNPNYDCYACQRNTFTAPERNGNIFANNDKLLMDVEFSMPHLLPDGSPPPPKNQKETIVKDDGFMLGSQSIALNDYETHETMIFDSVATPLNQAATLVLGKGTDKEAIFSRTAHSEGEMFGLKFWENWYILGENNADEPEFKFVYYNGKTRQNTYSGAFVYSRSRELSTESMAHVYSIAQAAGMNPEQFCKIRNGCFADEAPVQQSLLRGILASTKISQFLGVEPVAAEGVEKRTATAEPPNRPWWYEVGDYLEDPHRHFKAMDSLRLQMEWPENLKQAQSQ